MNKERRASLSAIVKDVTELQTAVAAAVAALSNVEIANLSGPIEEVKDEEQDSFDNLTEGLQATERGQQMQAAVEAMDEAMNTLNEIAEAIEVLDDLDGKIDEVLGYLDAAME